MGILGSGTTSAFMYVVGATLVQSSKLRGHGWFDCRPSFTNANAATILNLLAGKVHVIGHSSDDGITHILEH